MSKTVSISGMIPSEEAVPAAGPSRLSDEALQAYLLEGVSRTFALTIPQLPPKLSPLVSNAYLLCRIVDTIEDEPALTSEEKSYFCSVFEKVVSGREGAKAEDFAGQLHPLLSSSTIPEERELIEQTPRVIGITHGFDREVRDALEQCIHIMARGMAFFQKENSAYGLRDLPEMDRYCYHVAGVVGEMLTRLFCYYSPEIAEKREELMKLAVSFGQGLQMTNILKDIWEDNSRSACWLPRNFFEEAGLDLGDLEAIHHEEAFSDILARLVGIAHRHLVLALTYTLLIPGKEKGIRKFCLWAIGMAVLTLRKINRKRGFSMGEEVKISRWSVKATILATHFTVSSNRLMKGLFQVAGGRRLPLARSSDGKGSGENRKR